MVKKIILLFFFFLFGIYGAYADSDFGYTPTPNGCSIELYASGQAIYTTGGIGHCYNITGIGNVLRFSNGQQIVILVDYIFDGDYGNGMKNSVIFLFYNQQWHSIVDPYTMGVNPAGQVEWNSYYGTYPYKRYWSNNMIDEDNLYIHTMSYNFVFPHSDISTYTQTDVPYYGWYTATNWVWFDTDISIGNFTGEEIIPYRGTLHRNTESPNGFYITGIYVTKPLHFRTYINGTLYQTDTGSTGGVSNDITVESDDFFSELKNYTVHITYYLDSDPSVEIPFSDFIYRPTRVNSTAGGWINSGWSIVKYEDTNPKGFSLNNFTVNTGTTLTVYVDGVIMDNTTYTTDDNFYDYRHSDVFHEAKKYTIKLRSTNTTTKVYYDFATFTLQPTYAIDDVTDIFDQDCKMTQYSDRIRCTDFFDNNSTVLTFNLLTSQAGKFYQYGSGVTVSYTGSTRYSADGNSMWYYDYIFPDNLPYYDYTLVVTDSTGRERGSLYFIYTDPSKSVFGSGSDSTSNINNYFPVSASGTIDEGGWLQGLTDTITRIRQIFGLGDHFVTNDNKSLLDYVIGVPEAHADDLADAINSHINNYDSTDQFMGKITKFLFYTLILAIIILALLFVSGII